MQVDAWVCEGRQAQCEAALRSKALERVKSEMGMVRTKREVCF